jgi:hypothetical protein
VNKKSKESGVVSKLPIMESQLPQNRASRVSTTPRIQRKQADFAVIGGWHSSGLDKKHCEIRMQREPKA